jgi:hypothetical protein
MTPLSTLAEQNFQSYRLPNSDSDIVADHF